jgi:hypothetical protein
MTASLIERCGALHPAVVSDILDELGYRYQVMAARRSRRRPRAGLCRRLLPFQPFPVQRSAEAFHGAAIAVPASDTDLEERLDALARRLGATPVRVAESDRVLITR